MTAVPRGDRLRGGQADERGGRIRAHLLLVAIPLLWASLVLVPGCGHDKSSKPIEQPLSLVHLPLAVGDVWEYSVVDSTFRVPDPIYSVQTDSITGVAPHDGAQYFVLATAGGIADTTWLRQEGQRIYA